MDLLDALLPSSIRVTIGLNILMAWGFYVMQATGQISLGNAAFMAVGAYTSGVLTVKFGVPLAPAILIAVIVGALCGALVGFPALRVRGLYLAMMTIGVEEAVQLFLCNFAYVGGTRGMRGMTGTTEALVFASVLLVLLVLWKVENSRLGRSMDAVRDDEVAASVMGVNPTYIKMLSFAIGSAIAALAGALFAHYMFFVEPANFDIFRSLRPTFFVIFGGSQTLWGSLVGAILLTLLPEYARPIASWRDSIYGLVILAMIVWRPQGLISKAMVKAVGEYLRAWIPSRRPRSPGGIGKDKEFAPGGVFRREP